MKIVEFAKKGILSTKYAAAVTFAEQSGVSFESALPEISEALAAWGENRGKSAAEIMLTLIGPPERHAVFKSTLAQLKATHPELGPLFRRVEVRVDLMSENAKPIESFKLA